jgi:ATP-dependent DNA helicase RecQ
MLHICPVLTSCCLIFRSPMPPTVVAGRNRHLRGDVTHLISVSRCAGSCQPIMTSRTRSTRRTSTKPAIPTAKSQRPNAKSRASKSPGKKPAKSKRTAVSARNGRTLSKPPTQPKGKVAKTKQSLRPARPTAKPSASRSLRPTKSAPSKGRGGAAKSMPAKRKASLPRGKAPGRSTASAAAQRSTRLSARAPKVKAQARKRGRGSAAPSTSVDPRQLPLPFANRAPKRSVSKAPTAAPPKRPKPSAAPAAAKRVKPKSTQPVAPPPTSSGPVPFSMARLKERIEQEQARRKLAAEDNGPDSTLRALPVGVRRGRLSPRGERMEATPPSSHAHDFDALDRYLAGAGVVVESEALRSYLLPWLNGSDVLAFVPADRSALIGCSAVALANRMKALIVLPSEESVADQAFMLRSAGLEVATLSSNQEERVVELDRLRGERSYVLVVSLDRLLNEDVLDDCRRLSLDLLAIDETQRVSELAPDFDPGLERIADLAPRLGRPPTLALLRAVPPSVRSDLPHRLGLRNPLRIDLPPVHDALGLDVIATDQQKRTAQVVELVQNSLLPAVVLGYSMADVNDVMSALTNAGMDARRFEPGVRLTIQEQTAQAVWVASTGRVATPVQFAHTLVHFRSPPSLEQYCRDLGWVVHTSGHARSVMFVAADDEAMVKGTLERQRPRAEDLIGIASVLVRHGSNSSTVLLDSLCPAVGMNRARVESLVSILARTGWVDHAQDWIRLRPDCPDLIERARGLGARLKTAKERDAQRLRSVSAYVVSRGCRQESLRRHFGTAGSRPCGLCDACLSGRNVAPPPSSGRSVDEGNSPVSRMLQATPKPEAPSNDGSGWIRRRRLIHF